jgi:hypothetical protein
MNTQTVTIEVAPQTPALLQAKAEGQGMTLDELLRSTIEAPTGATENGHSMRRRRLKNG